MICLIQNKAAQHNKTVVNLSLQAYLPAQEQTIKNLLAEVNTLKQRSKEAWSELIQNKAAQHSKIVVILSLLAYLPVQE